MTNNDLRHLIYELGRSCGFPLALVEGSVTVEGDYVSATAISQERVLDERQVNIGALAKILATPETEDTPCTWALLFFYVNGIRVAPAGLSHMRLRFDRDKDGAPRWVASGWEADEFGEWSELVQIECTETLPVEP